MPGPVVLLGPQRPHPNLRAALDLLERLGAAAPSPRSGPIVCISAGWRQDEADEATLRRDIHPDAVSLPLYAAFERISRTAPELASAYKERQARVRKIKALYRVRLHPAISAARRLVSRRHEDPELVDHFLTAAVGSLQEIDRGFLELVGAVHQAFEARFDPQAHDEVAQVRARAQELLLEARAVVITGGHVGVLRNRLAFFGMDGLLCAANAAGLGVAAWSAGAMALTERVVLFHDDPPHGVGDPELLDRGLGVVPRLVLFPDANHRLRLDDAPRVGALARRFGPARCVTLESGAMLSLQRGRWVNHGPRESAHELSPKGVLLDLPQAEADDAPGA